MYWTDARTWEFTEQITGFIEPVGARRAAPPWRAGGRRQAISGLVARLDIATNLRVEIGSARWLRGAGLLAALLFVTWLLASGLPPLVAAPSMRLSADGEAQMRELAVAPQALGGDSGWRMGPLPSVSPLAFAPERPRIALTTTLAPGDTMARMLRRAGVGAGDAAHAEALLASAVPLGDIAPGTHVALTLGARGAAGGPRPLEALSLRPRLDMALALNRRGSSLALSRRAIAVDSTPMRISGTVGPSLFLSAQQAGAPAQAAQQYLEAINAHFGIDNVEPADAYTLIIDHKRAADGTSAMGGLLYAGLNRDGRPRARLLRWGGDFVDAASMEGGHGAPGIISGGSGMILPVGNARITSPYGMRFHPILGYTRMHAGIDYAVGTGTPIRAAAAGVVTFVGVHGGHGNYVRIEHGGGLGSGYAHMSRFAVSVGERVRAGQIIGAVGMTGLATGPHLHWEVYRDGHTVNPLSLRLAGAVATVDPRERAAFRARLKQLLLAAR